MKKYRILILLFLVIITSCATVIRDKYPQLQRKGYASFSAIMKPYTGSGLEDIWLGQEINGKEVFLGLLNTPSDRSKFDMGLMIYNIIAAAPPGKAKFYIAGNEIIIDIEEDMITNVQIIFSGGVYLPSYSFGQSAKYKYSLFYNISKPVKYIRK